MKDRIMYYKLTKDPDEENWRMLAEEVPSAVGPELDGVFIDRGRIYSHDTNKFEPITEIVREDNELNRSRYDLAQKKYNDVDKEEITNLFPRYSKPFLGGDVLVKSDYQMSYTDDVKRATDRYNFKSLFYSETITIKSAGEEISVNSDDVKFVTYYSYDQEVYRADVYNKGNIIFLDLYSRTLDVRGDELIQQISTDSLSFNLETGLTYHFKSIDPASRRCDEMKNVTTGSLDGSKFAVLPDSVLDVVKDITAEYWLEKTGVETKFYELEKRMDTLRSVVFNPNNNVLYLYKPFFNTRFRQYFKRDDASSNHFAELCKLIGVEYDERYIALAANCHKDLFVAKCLADAGVKNVDNQLSMIKTLHEFGWTNGILCDFIDKFYGENTDFLYPIYGMDKNNLDALCTYVKKAIPYTSEDEFVAMFNRSFVQHNKYWKRSLHQVATVIKMEGGSRELLRKACSYGLNKIQSDGVDLAYDKVMSRNRYINYAKEITDSECTIGESVFKLALDTHDCASLLEAFKLDDKTVTAMALDVAQGNYNIIFVKDKGGELLGYMKYRGIFLMEARFTKGSVRTSAEEARIACIEWCDRFGVKQYRCEDLKYSLASKKRF